MYNTDDLAQIESAILKLQSGERVVSVAYGDHAVKYAEVDLQELISLRNKIRREPWLSRVLLKLYELDQYDDAELVRKKTAAMFAGFITRLDPESNFVGEADRFFLCRRVTSV